MEVLPLRLLAGDDLRGALEAAVIARQCSAAFVLSGIGSLSAARLRYAGETELSVVDGPLEILSLAGTVSGSGSHLHIGVANAQGRVVGGHVGRGCIVRTTAEVLLALMQEWSFSRKPDPATGYSELVMLPKR